MPFTCYVPKVFRGANSAIVATANRFLADYKAQGFVVTGRQIYYKFIATDALPESWIDKEYNLKHGLHPDTKNTLKNYKNLLSILNDARLAGIVDWNSMEDQTRNLQGFHGWNNPQELLDVYGSAYRRKPWETQDTYVEVWVEKDALSNVIERACQTYRVPHFSTRGYVSQSEAWSASQRFINSGKECHIIHLADHDPSGMDMTNDLAKRMDIFGASIEIHRVGLNMDQVRKYKCPPNPAKITDSRAEGYMREHGDESWELDALEPKVIIPLITDEIEMHINQDAWDEAIRLEEQERAEILAIATNFDKVTQFLKRK
jgi:hypothetical protein